MTRAYDEPIDIHDAEWRATTLQDEIERIEEQIGSDESKKERASGRPLSIKDYEDWKARAQDALYHKRMELGYVTAWIRRKTGVGGKNDLLNAVELAMPVILHIMPVRNYPVIENLADAFGMVTGSHA